jgi:hypothetical protein
VFIVFVIIEEEEDRRKQDKNYKKRIKTWLTGFESRHACDELVADA